MIALAAGIVMQVASYATMPGVDSLPRNPLSDSLRIAEARFLNTWRREWMVGRRGQATYIRLAALHCHHDGSWQSGAPNIIRGESARSFCPTWLAAEDSLPADEGRDGIDASLSEEGRRNVRRARGALIARFDAAFRRHPEDPWLVGQLVRLAIDQQESATALRAARACAAPRPWCVLLEGYVHHADGRVQVADTIFARAVSLMRPTDRCAWTSIAPLLDARARAAYERVDCAARDSIHAAFWWLADPLYIEPGNARRAEHFARLVRVRLHAALNADERWDWRKRYSGEALASMIVRYGWPSNLYWAGYREDGGHFSWLGFKDDAINVAPEYTLPRFHTTPPWSAVLDPSTLTADDWANFAPRIGYGALDWENDRWPREHWPRTLGPVLEVADQTVFFRRDNDALMAIGLDVPQRFIAPGSRVPYDAAIVAARDPTDRWVPSRESIVLDGTGTTVLVSPISARAQVVSAELAPADAGPGMAARARRAVHPPPPLSVLGERELAISDPLFFRAADLTEPPSNASIAVGRMYGSRHIGDRRIGVFWEVYGATRDDTVETSIRLASIDKPGLMRRLGSSLGILDEVSSELTMTWREPGLGRPEALMFAGDVAIQARGVVLDVSRLRPGNYMVEISLTRQGSAPAVTRRDIRITR
jgi:hypothetical protein